MFGKLCFGICKNTLFSYSLQTKVLFFVYFCRLTTEKYKENRKFTHRYAQVQSPRARFFC